MGLGIVKKPVELCFFISTIALGNIRASRAISCNVAVRLYNNYKDTNILTVCLARTVTKGTLDLVFFCFFFASFSAEVNTLYRRSQASGNLILEEMACNIWEVRSKASRYIEI